VEKRGKGGKSNNQENGIWPQISAEKADQARALGKAKKNQTPVKFSLRILIFTYHHYLKLFIRRFRCYLRPIYPLILKYLDYESLPMSDPFHPPFLRKSVAKISFDFYRDTTLLTAIKKPRRCSPLRGYENQSCVP